ncbi:MAG: hypothetical protein H7Y02_02520 [Candidatus Obscuribacterales bacterium]|nr:hypothetical protein [Steroidobacteraceae bacterium]
MHRSFAAWLSEKSWRAGLFSAIFGLLSPQGLSPVAAAAGAVSVLITLRDGAKSGANVALAGSVAVVAMLIAAGQSWGFAIACAGGVFFAPWALAVLLRRTGALNLCFQLAVLSAGLVLCAIYVVLDDPVGTWMALVHDAAQAVAKSGWVADEEAFFASLATFNWGTYVALWLLTGLGALFLGRWWQSLTSAPGAFGAEFRQLRLGVFLGVACVAVAFSTLVCSYFEVKVPMLSALNWLALMALALQGLAAIHTLKAAGRIGRGWLIAVYVLLVIFNFVTVIALAGWGMADNWQRTRAQV